MTTRSEWVQYLVHPESVERPDLEGWPVQGVVGPDRMTVFVGDGWANACAALLAGHVVVGLPRGNHSTVPMTCGWVAHGPVWIVYPQDSRAADHVKPFDAVIRMARSGNEDTVVADHRMIPFDPAKPGDLVYRLSRPLFAAESVHPKLLVVLDPPPEALAMLASMQRAARVPTLVAQPSKPVGLSPAPRVFLRDPHGPVRPEVPA